MQYVTEFRDREKAQAIAEEIRREAKPDKSYRFMEFAADTRMFWLAGD